MSGNFSHLKISILLFLNLCMISTAGLACTRILLANQQAAVMVGRTMDWPAMNMNTTLRVYPRGIMHEGANDTSSLKWSSKYGSIVATAYNAITTDGINEQGLATHILWLDEANYGQRDTSKPGLSVILWAQYYLDNFKSVAEAVQFTEENNFQLLAFFHPTVQKWIKLHLAIEDASGDSAIIEYTDGKPHVYHDRAYKVLTNSPTYDLQLKNLPAYGDKPLPGSTNSVDRFIRGWFYVTRLPVSQNMSDEIMNLQSVINNVAEPFGVPTKERPGIGPTIWRTISDLTHRVYYFNSAGSLNMVWVELDKFNLQPGNPVMKLDVFAQPDLTGNVTDKFKTFA